MTIPPRDPPPRDHSSSTPVSPFTNEHLNYLQRQSPQSQPAPPPRPPVSLIRNEEHSLSTALSSLKQLTTLSRRTLSSLPRTLQRPPNSNNDPCPYDPNHFMPAASVFSHYLRCHCSSFRNIYASPSALYQNLHYPKTLRTSNKISFEILPQGENDGVLLSLDGHFREFSSNFFYNMCPAVVCIKDVSLTGRSFFLPSFLLSECGECTSYDDSRVDKCGILQSDWWSVKKEVDCWMESPEKYSYRVSCSVSRLNLVDNTHLYRSIVNGSHLYGVLIDMYMKDHISILFRLCFASMRREAVGNLRDAKRLNFECPVVFRCLTWLISQLSILYGNENAKAFAMYTFKQSVLEGANQAVLGCLKAKTIGSYNDSDSENFPTAETKGEQELESRTQQQNDDSKTKQEGLIILSQVVAAVAALHERSLLERQIRMFSYPTTPSVHQRVAEYEHDSKQAADERQKRTYRPIIDHDGPFRRNAYNQETSNKIKTVEELLAEERDYKRRRTSYRGKKSNRTMVEVMRDVIEEYMEEIKQAGGI